MYAWLRGIEGVWHVCKWTADRVSEGPYLAIKLLLRFEFLDFKIVQQRRSRGLSAKTSSVAHKFSCTWRISLASVLQVTTSVPKRTE